MISVTVTNQKGGVSKTTTAHAMGAALARRGYRVLFVDLDPQGNLSHGLQASAGLSAFELLTKSATVADVIQKTEQGEVIPASAGLSAADVILSTVTGKEYRLREALEPVQAFYDFAIIDTPPALGALTVNAMTAADILVIPAMADVFSLQGIGQLADTIQTVRRYCNPGLKLGGVLLTRHSGRTILSRDMAELIGRTAEQLGTTVYKTCVRECVALKEAQASRESIFQYAPRSNAAKDYEAFTLEFLEGLNHG